MQCSTSLVHPVHDLLWWYTSCYLAWLPFRVCSTATTRCIERPGETENTFPKGPPSSSLSTVWRLYLTPRPNQTLCPIILTKFIFKGLIPDCGLSQGCLSAFCKLGTVAGHVIQENGRLSFEDDLRSGGLLYCEPASALSLLTVWSLGRNPGMARCWRKTGLSCWIHPAAQSTLGFAGEWAQCSFPDQNRRTKVLCGWDDSSGLLRS